jgi:hypothetical protein
MSTLPDVWLRRCDDHVPEKPDRNTQEGRRASERIYNDEVNLVCSLNLATQVTCHPIDVWLSAAGNVNDGQLHGLDHMLASNA